MHSDGFSRRSATSVAPCAYDWRGKPVTLRYLSRLRHIPLGAKHRHRTVTLLVAGRHVRVVAEDGSLLRELTLDPARDYQPLGRPPGPPPRLGHHDVRQVATIS